MSDFLEGRLCKQSLRQRTLSNIRDYGEKSQRVENGNAFDFIGSGLWLPSCEPGKVFMWVQTARHVMTGRSSKFLFE